VTSAIETRRLLRVREAAERLTVSEQTVYRLIERGELPALRIAGAIRLDARELEHWLYGPREER
jgi:excisionase family DNA binding protein